MRRGAGARVVGMLTLGLATGGVMACDRGEHTPAATAGDPVAVTVTHVAAIDTAERLEAGGVVTARDSATVSSRLVAAIAAVHVDAGDRVRAGAPLITLDAPDVAERTDEARAGALAAEKAVVQAHTLRTAAQAEHRLAAAWHTRVAALHARRSATDQERDEADARIAAAAARLAGAEAGVEAAEAALAAARAAVGAATATESFTTLRAPFDGLVTERLTDPGNLAGPGVPLLRVESDGARQAVVRVDEARAVYVRPGDRVSVLVDEGDARLTENGGIEGVVAEVARAIGADQRAFTVTIDLPQAVSARTGSFARAVFRGAPRRALVVPADAVRWHGQVSSVYVVADGVARLRLIRAGPVSGDGVEVLAGLDAGESVVVDPPARLVDGATIAGPGGRLDAEGPR